MKEFNLPREKKSVEVRKMFSHIAPYYDFLNHTLSFGFDLIWRKKSVRNFLPEENQIFLDLCSGTGDFGKELSKRGKAKIIGIDFSLDMLKLARKKTKKIFFVNADGLSMPFKDGTFDGCIVGFGIRNFEDIEKGICEIARVLKSGGKFLILEFPREVKGIFAPFFNLYFRFILPKIGKWISGSDFAYTYLPLSTKFFPSNENLVKLLEKYGFEEVKIKNRTFGTVIEILAKKK